MNKADYGRFETAYLAENVKFADSKAGVLIGVNGLLLRTTVEYLKSGGTSVVALLEPATLPQRVMLGLGSVFLLAGVILATSVVFPRRGSVGEKGFVYWESIAKYASAEEYTNAVMGTSEEDLDRIMAEQHYYISKAATRKYLMLRRAFWASSIGASVIVLTALTME